MRCDHADIVRQIVPNPVCGRKNLRSEAVSMPYLLVSICADCGRQRVQDGFGWTTVWAPAHLED